MILVFLIGAYSIGGFFDPVTGGISLRAGGFKGFRLHLVGGFGEGENQIYNENWDYVWKPYHWINAEAKIEKSFPSKGWFQPYIGVGVAYRDAAGWTSDWVYEPDTSYYVVEEIKESYQSLVIGLGFEISYFAEMAKGIPFIEDLSFVIEFPVVYYKFKNETSDSCGNGGGG